MFEKLFKFSTVLFLINVLVVVIKDIMLGGETTKTGNGLLTFVTIIFTIAMFITSIFFIKNRNSDSVKNYRGLYYTVLVFTPIVWLLAGHYIFSPLPELLSHTNM